MAIYRNIQMTFWTDSKVVDDFTPEDRYFYLYLLTNPHTNLAGCYEISLRQMETETGYNRQSVENLLKRFAEVHKIAVYSTDTKELLLVNWSRYNWTNSEKFRKPLQAEIETVKNPCFREFLEHRFHGEDTVSIPYQYGMDTTVSVTDTDTVTDAVPKKRNGKVSQPNRPEKHKYGEFKNVLLTDEEYGKLKERVPDCEAWIEKLSVGIASKGYSYKSHYAALLNWVRKEQTSTTPIMKQPDYNAGGEDFL